MVFSSNDPAWNNQYVKLKSFKAEHGHCNVPQRSKNLGRWVNHQREQYKNEELRLDRIAMLEAIGFCWDAREAVWEIRLRQLVTFQEKNGHCKVPQNNSALGGWVKEQRDAFKKRQLRRDRIKMLEDIGFSWDPLLCPWDDRFQQLVEFKEQNGHCKVPTKQEGLGRWVGKQRERYKTGKLSRERIDRLEGIGFVWDGWKSPEVAEGVQKGVAEETDVGRAQSESQGSKGASSKHGSGKKTANKRNASELVEGRPKRTKMLVKAPSGMLFSANDSAWNNQYVKLKSFKAEHGHCNVPQRHKNLGRWVNRQREHYKNEELRLDRIEMLEAIGFCWDAREAVWELRLRQLVEFQEKHGHCHVPQNNSSLGFWVKEQRDAFKKNRLRRDRIEMLEDIGFSWDPQFHCPWDDRFQQLVDFKGGNGHCNVPRKQEGLGRWVGKQREMYKAGKLSRERIDRLEGIGFVWDRRKSLEVDEGVQKRGAAEQTNAGRAQRETQGSKGASSKHGSGTQTEKKRTTRDLVGGRSKRTNMLVDHIIETLT